MSSDPSPAVRALVRKRSHDVCERCGIRAGAEIHHRRHRSQGVDNRVSNLVHLCTDCHRWLEHHPSAAHNEGYWLRAGEEAEKVAVRYQHRWAFLDDSGGIRWQPPLRLF